MPSSSQIRRPRAILFDNDGVLVASEPLHWEAWGHLLTELGLPYHVNEVHAQVGKTGPEILSTLLDIHRPGWSATEYDVHALAKSKNDFYLELVRNGLKPYPGVEEGLKWLRSQGVRLAVVTNAKRREMEGSLERVGLISLFDALVSRDDVPAFKPDPTPYLFAAASVGIEPADCIGVEDSPPGLESILMARIPAAAVLTNFSREVVEQPVLGRPDLRPMWIGRDTGEFLEWVKKLF